MKLLVSTVAPYPWVKLGKHDRPVDKGAFLEAAFLSTIPREVTSVIGVAPADSTTFHHVEVPTKKRGNMLAAVPYALEDSLSEELDQLHFTVMSWVPEGPAHVVVIARQLIGDWLEVFSTAGVRLDAIVPELMLLPIHPDADTTVIRQDKDQYAIKIGPYSSFSCDSDAFEYWWSDGENRQRSIAVNDQEFAGELMNRGGQFVSQWAIGGDFRSWLEHAPEQLKAAPSMLHKEFEPEHLKPGSNWLSVAAGLAFCALVALGISHWFEAARLQQRYDANQQAIRTLFEEAFPGQEYLDQPRRQIASLLSISEDEPADEMFQYLLSVPAQLASQNNAELEEINYRDQQLQIGVTVPNFAALEQFTGQINALDTVQAVLISSGSRDQRVTGQIKIAGVN